MADTRLGLDIFKDLKMPELWSAKFSKYKPSVPGYYDLVADWVALCLQRLITAEKDNRPIDIDLAIQFIHDATSGQQLSILGDFTILGEYKQLEAIVDFVAYEKPWEFESKLLKKERDYMLDIIEDGNVVKLCVDLESVDTFYNNPKYALPLDTWPDHRDDEYLGNDLRKQQAKIKSKFTKNCGLNPEFSLYKLDAQERVFEAYWYKHKERGKKVDGMNGAAYTNKGRKIIENHDCFIRCLIHRFASLSIRDQKMMQGENPQGEAWLKKMNFTTAQAYDWKMIKFVFQKIALKIKANGPVSLLELEHNFLANGPFFVDRELIITCLHYLHRGVRMLLENDDVFVIGDGKIGPIGQICIDSTGLGKFPKF